MGQDVSRRELLGVIGTIGGGLAGCVGTDGDANDGEIPPPDTYPAGLSADGPDLETLQGRIEDSLGAGSVRYEALAQHRDIGAETLEGEGLALAVDHTIDRGYLIYGESPVQVTDPLEAVEVEKCYIEGDQAYEVENFGTPRPVEKAFGTLTGRMESHLAAVVDVVTAIEWGSPQWNRDRGVYIVTGTDFTATRPPVTEA